MIEKIPDPQFQYYPSDTWYTAVVGADELPDVFVGRIPAHSLAEAEGVFQKIVNYEQTTPAPASWSGRALLVSEFDSRYNFFNSHNSIDPEADLRNRE